MLVMSKEIIGKLIKKIKIPTITGKITSSTCRSSLNYKNRILLMSMRMSEIELTEDYCCGVSGVSNSTSSVEPSSLVSNLESESAIFSTISLLVSCLISDSGIS